MAHTHFMLLEIDPWEETEQEQVTTEIVSTERTYCVRTGKVRHHSHAEASRQQSNLPYKGKGVDAYKCQFCNDWHLGRSSRR